MGIGMVVVVRSSDVSNVLSILEEDGIPAWTIGDVTDLDIHKGRVFLTS
jgi:phosphoribosylaminoimidazole (AIR) synthetase